MAHVDDVLISGDDKPPWRPTRRQTRVTATAVAAVTAVVAGAWLGTDWVLDRAAAEDIRLQTTTGFEQGLSIAMVSLGTRPVTVARARLDGPGNPDVTVDVPLVPGVTRTVGVPTGGACPDDPFAPVPHDVVLTLRTERGELVRRTVDLEEELAHEVEERERERCGIPPLDTTVDVRLVSSRLVGDAVEAVYELWSTAVLPVTVSDWRPGAGMVLGTTPPALDLPAGEAPSVAGDGRTVMVRVRPMDCGAWDERLRDPPVDTGGRLEAIPLVVLTATRQDGATERFLGIQLDDAFSSAEDDELLATIQDLCAPDVPERADGPA